MTRKGIVSFIKKNRGSRAAEMLEFALVIPFILILMFGMFDVSKILIMYTEVAYVCSEELNLEVTNNSNPDIKRAARNAQNRLTGWGDVHHREGIQPAKGESIFKGAIIPNGQAEKPIEFLAVSPKQISKQYKNPGTKGAVKKAGNKMGSLVCIDARVPVKMLTPIFGKEAHIYKQTCTVNEATELQNNFDAYPSNW